LISGKSTGERIVERRDGGDIAMEVILRQDVDELGLEGDIVNVAKGYARNYLVPNGFALQATPQNMKALELQRKKIEVKRLKGRESAEKLKEKMAELIIHVSQKAGEEGKLYGSVTTMDIAAYLEAQGIEIDRRKISLDKPIKTVGEYDIPVRIYPKVTGSIKVVVSPEQVQKDAAN
jgi:large subunit ribosomal protein L9